MKDGVEKFIKSTVWVAIIFFWLAMWCFVEKHSRKYLYI